jgi:hypothetical protein
MPPWIILHRFKGGPDKPNIGYPAHTLLDPEVAPTTALQ